MKPPPPNFLVKQTSKQMKWLDYALLKARQGERNPHSSFKKVDNDEGGCLFFSLGTDLSAETFPPLVNQLASKPFVSAKSQPEDLICAVCDALPPTLLENGKTVGFLE